MSKFNNLYVPLDVQVLVLIVPGGYICMKKKTHIMLCCAEVGYEP